MNVVTAKTMKGMTLGFFLNSFNKEALCLFVPFKTT